MLAPVRNGKGAALVIGSAVCFGTLGVFGKLAYRLGLTTPQLLSYRFALAAVLLWLAATVIRQPFPPRRSLVGLAIMGGAGYVGQSGSYFSALHFIPASTNALLLYTFPVVVTLLAALLFREALGWIKLAACGLAFLGTDGRGRYSDVFYDRMEKMQRDSGANPGRLLGTVAAHEIGHLLLGSNSHSAMGLMSAHWGEGELRRVGMGGLKFSAEQAGRMRVHIDDWQRGEERLQAAQTESNE